jgi:hypothetical protein
MITDEFETDLREALARCAADVPAHVGERLRQHNYHPRRPRRRFMTGLGAAVVAIGTATVILGPSTTSTRTPQATHHAASSTTPARHLTRRAFRLADYTIPLPAGFQQVDSPCAPAPSGIQAPIPFLGSRFAAAASNAGGCIDVLLASSASRPPAGSTSVNVGRYQGSLVTNQSSGVITLYVTIPADLYIHTVSPNGEIDSTSVTLDVVLTAKGLSVNDVESIAAASVPSSPIPPAGSCSGSCG